MIERHTISRSQFCELLEIDPARLIGLEGVGLSSTTFTLVLEGDGDDDMAMTRGGMPPMFDNTQRRMVVPKVAVPKAASRPARTPKVATPAVPRPPRAPSVRMPKGAGKKGY